jgi:hypothetical protein
MRSRQITTAAAAVALAFAAAPASADPPARSDHGHILVLGIESQPGTFPPLPIAARNCVDLGNNQALPESSHHDHRHEDFDGGDFRERTGHIVIPTWPYEVMGQTVPWRNCDDFMAMFGLG